MQTLPARSIAVLAPLMLSSPAIPHEAQPRTTAQGNAAAARLDAHDLSGVWQLAAGGGGQGPGDNFPPLTPWGQAKYDANKPGYGPKNGNLVHWGVETNSPSILTRAGWTIRSVKPGDEVTIILCPAKNGAPIAYAGSGDPGTEVIFSNGKELDFQDKTTK